MNDVFRLLCQLTNQLSVKDKFPEVDQHAGGKWLIHVSKHHKGN